MGGQGGFFGSQQSTPQVPVPVETIPGARGLGQALINYFLPMLSGQKAQAPYQGYASVYGRGTPTLNAGNQMTWQGGFPGLYTNANPAPAPSAPSTPDANFQNSINQAVAQALAGAGTPSYAMGGSGGGGGNA